MSPTDSGKNKGAGNSEKRKNSNITKAFYA